MLLIPSKGVTQENNEEKKPVIDFHGFIKSDYWYDSRAIAGARDELFLLYPLKPELNDNGIDVNEYSSFNFSAITSRINATIAVPDALNAKVTGFMEADFSGISNADIDGFRLRHAFLKLNWKNRELILGQYWHPMFVTEVFPTVLALNTGAPFQPFIRSPQLRITQSLGKFQLTGAALSQLDYMSEGPLGRSTSYIRHAKFPNLHLQLKYKAGAFTLGSAIDYKSLQPNAGPDKEGQYSTVESFSTMVYAKYAKGPFTIKGKFIDGENMTEHLLLGGYMARMDTLQGLFTSFKPSKHYFAWVNGIYKHNNWDFSFFAGYAKRRTQASDNQDAVFARGMDIDYCYRLSPMVSVNYGKLKFCLETEYTVAAYDTPGSVAPESGDEVDEVGNYRIQFTGFLFF